MWDKRYFKLTKKKKKETSPVCLLENSFLLESEFRENELLSDVW
jgi:hypothetical protein